MATALPKYRASDLARFDFRIPDNLGGYLYPDWADLDLKVEFYDGDGVLQTTITVASTPAMTQEVDGDGYFVAIEALDISSYALGPTEAWIYCQVSAANVQPYPTIIEAFEVLADPIGVAYTTATKVKSDLPDSLPATLTDNIISGYIVDNSRIIDGYLSNPYTTPFADIEDTVPTPAIIERVCRLLSLCDCGRFMGKINNVEGTKDEDGKEGMRLLDDLKSGKLRIGAPDFAPIATAEITRTDQLSEAELLYADSDSED